MPHFLALPQEVRFQIYRELRSLKSPLIKNPFQEDFSELGYCSFGFHSRILETNGQISDEAKEIFYGENFWTFFVARGFHLSSILFQTRPMVLILPFIRKAHIRFGMFHWLFWESRGLTSYTSRSTIKVNVKEIYKVLLTAPALRTVKIIWTETGTAYPGSMQMQTDSVRGLIADVLRPLATLPTTIELQKSNIMVAYRDGAKATDMELDFSEAVDEVIGLHRSRRLF